MKTGFRLKEKKDGILQRAGLFLICCGLLIWSGCKTVDSKDRIMSPDDYIKHWTEKANVSKAYLDVDTDIPDGIIPEEPEEPAGTEIPAKAIPQEEAPEEDIGLELNEPALPTNVIEHLTLNRPVPIGDFLRAMGKVARQNVFFRDGLEGTVQFKLSSPTTWDKLFRTVLRIEGLTYDWEGNILCVLSQEDINKALTMEKARMDRNMVENTTLQVAPLQVCTIRIRYSDAENIKESLELMLTKQSIGSGSTDSTRGSVNVDKGNNTIIINAIEGDIRKMMSLVARLDRPVTQVLIEAHIVEATKDTARELGIQWGGLYEGIAGNSLVSVGNGLGSSDYMVDFPASITDGEGFSVGGVLERITGTQLLNIQLSALEKKGRLNILSSPSITTLDNQTASIESGKEVPYQVKSGSGETQDTTTEWKKAVLRLEVTPHVIDSGLVKLRIITNKDELDDSYTSDDGLPRVITKKAETTLILRDGQTTVIGGLSKQYSQNNRSGIPGLQDIPYAGAAFRNNSTGTSMEDLLIFITPHMLNRAKRPATAQLTPLTPSQEVEPAALEAENEMTIQDALGLDNPGDDE
ncbi:MAG: type IV pilus secretin PilQ [Spartobacteria bacterium]|nr:type IV pilus secretin PilQ [Spartobacteria bacterium]